MEVDAVPPNQQGIRPVGRVAISCLEEVRDFPKLVETLNIHLCLKTIQLAAKTKRKSIGSISVGTQQTDNGFSFIKRAGEQKPDEKGPCGLIIFMHLLKCCTLV